MIRGHSMTKMTDLDKELLNKVYTTITTQWTDHMIDKLVFDLQTFLFEKDLDDNPDWESKL